MQKPLFKDQYIVVTGGLGFIGSCVIRYLNDLGYENIVVVDDFGQEKTKWRNLLGKRVWELISREELFSWLDQHAPETAAILHLGAVTNLYGSDNSYYHLNYNYSIQLVQLALNYGIRFIYASSSTTYGDGSQGFTDDHDLLDRLRPRHLYGFSKHLFDTWLYRKGLLEKVVGLKYFNVFGCNESYLKEEASLIYRAYQEIRSTGIMKLTKIAGLDGVDVEKRFDWIYVKDAVAITCDFLFQDLCGIYNVGSGRATSDGEIVGYVFSALNMPIQIEYEMYEQKEPPLLPDYSCANMEKLDSARYFGEGEQRPHTALFDAIQDYVQRYLTTDEIW